MLYNIISVFAYFSYYAFEYLIRTLLSHLLCVFLETLFAFLVDSVIELVDQSFEEGVNAEKIRGAFLV